MTAIPFRQLPGAVRILPRAVRKLPVAVRHFPEALRHFPLSFIQFSPLDDDLLTAPLFHGFHLLFQLLQLHSLVLIQREVVVTVKPPQGMRSGWAVDPVQVLQSADVEGLVQVRDIGQVDVTGKFDQDHPRGRSRDQRQGIYLLPAFLQINLEVLPHPVFCLKQGIGRIFVMGEDRIVDFRHRSRGLVIGFAGDVITLGNYQDVVQFLKGLVDRRVGFYLFFLQVKVKHVAREVGGAESLPPGILLRQVGEKILSGQRQGHHQGDAKCKSCLHGLMLLINDNFHIVIHP